MGRGADGLNAMARNDFLRDRSFALSISDSPDLAELGYGPEHLRDAMVEMARHLLSSGARLLYGGDLRSQGFTELLFELVERHRPETDEGQPFVHAVTNYLPWPVHISLSAEELSARAKDLAPFASLICLGVDGDVVEPANRRPIVVSQDDWSSGLTSMRTLLTRLGDVRVLLGGRVSDYQGALPGIAEEALLTMRARKPVFLVGGFGGCARDIAEMVGLIDVRKTARTIDWEGKRHFANFTAQNLRNGLSDDENAVLARTAHIDQAVGLILRGAARLFEGRID